MAKERRYRAIARTLTNTRLSRWAQARLAGSPVVRHILTLVSGTVVAQAAALVINIFVARIFTADDFGRLALVTSVAAIVLTVAAGRFDMTMMLPESDDEARQLKHLSTRLIIIVSVLASVICLVIRPFLADHYHDTELSWVFACVGIMVFFQADAAVLQYWYNRKTRYGVIAVNRAQQTIAVYLIQLLFGLLGFANIWGLFIGNTLGLAIAWIYLFRKATDLRQPVAEGTPSMKQLAWRYRKMPLLNGPNAIVDAIRLNGINMIIGATSTSALGQFNLAWRMMQVPLTLITGAVSQVFFQKLATVKRGEMTPLVNAVMKRSLIVGVPIFALVALLSPWAFPFIFGHQWVEAGRYGQVLCPWMCVMLLTSPISTIFVVTETQGWLLGFSIVYCVVPLAWLELTPYGLASAHGMFMTITVLSLLMAVMLIAMLVMAVIVAKRYDAQASSAA
ncbi:MAG: oligosaccharide flippase family protein [Actinomycetaceae bacterium]|nr:oligosaccharide flippase family protein [Actinomycetaceae bacterium]MDU0969740.1 oligosaccharide flippase family protein [Actinomycetaceae bacterium]